MACVRPSHRRSGRHGKCSYLQTLMPYTNTRAVRWCLKISSLGGNSTKGHYWVSSKCIAKFVIPVYLAQNTFWCAANASTCLLWCFMHVCKEKREREKKNASLDGLNLCIDLRCIQSNGMPHHLRSFFLGCCCLVCMFIVLVAGLLSLKANRKTKIGLRVVNGLTCTSQCRMLDG